MPTADDLKVKMGKKVQISKAKEDAIETILEAARMQKSAFISRDQIGEFTGGAFSPRYMANLDSLGLGPDGTFKLGRKKMYSLRPLVQWMIARLKV